MRFLPFSLALYVADCINIIKRHELNTVLIVLKGVKPWTLLLEQLPVIAEQSVSSKRPACQFGSQAFIHMKCPGFRLHLKACTSFLIEIS